MDEKKLLYLLATGLICVGLANVTLSIIYRDMSILAGGVLALTVGRISRIGYKGGNENR